ncbi:MAG: 6-carboxytetrahydropterin synthase [Holophagales bacterium]|nr:6-carboxytetrahydropterin synthase [Holophagales bacterium]
MATYTLRVRDRFEASHWLRSYRGQPEPIHGHSWTVEVILETDELDSEGMGFDFVEVRSNLRELVARFDHGDINSVPPFDVESPTTEHLARYFHRELRRRLAAASVAEVTVWEGPDCSATYRP